MMDEVYWPGWIFVGFLVITGMFYLLLRQKGIRFLSRRERLYRKGLSSRQKRFMRQVALVRILPPALQSELEHKTAVFLGEKRFEGTGSLKVTERMKVMIAAEACLLLLNKPCDYYPTLSCVIVEPCAYRRTFHEPLHQLTLETHDVPVSGESWGSGEVVLAWEDVRAEAQTAESPYHVVLHEFAHQLDQLDGAADGIPLLANMEYYQRWKTVMSNAYEEIREELSEGRESVIDPYGATDPAEFFAVGTETFFGTPLTLREHLPELYALFASYYQLDPAQWHAGGKEKISQNHDSGGL